MTKETFWSKNKATIRFCLIFGNCIVFLFFLAHTEYAHETVGKYYPELIAQTVRHIVGIFGIETTIMGRVIAHRGFAMEIIYHCSAVFASIIYVSAIIAYPASLGRKVIGMFLGVPLLAFINIVRLGVMFLIGIKYPQVFELFHEYLWQGIFIIFVVVLWMLWIEQIAER